MDILAVSTASVNGVNRAVYAELKRRGWNIELVVPKTYPISSSMTLKAEPARPNDPPLHVLKMKGKNPRTFRFPEIKKLIASLKPKVVIMESDPVSYMALQLGVICKQHHSNLFALSCENLSFDILPTLRRRGIKSLPTSFVKQALFLIARPLIHTVYTINNDGTALFLEKGFSRVIKIPLGFDPSLFFPNEITRTAIRTKLNLQGPVIAYFGRITEEKGVDILLHALESIKDMRWHFIMDKFDIYTNNYHRHIESLVTKLELRNRITTIDANHFEIADYMNAADVVVIPSISTSIWKEQYGRVAPETMACGKVVIISKSGALPELVQETGLAFDEGNVNQLSSLLVDYLNNPFRYENMSKQASERAVNFLSIYKQADIYEKSFRQLNINPSK
jgi:glycosyltransferase involved in cell wall biosynthesis